MRLGEIEQIASGQHWIIPRYHEVLRSGPSTIMQLHALQKIMDRPVRNRQGSFSASSAGGCLRARQLQYMGAEKAPLDERSLNIFENGDFFHLRMQVAGLIGKWLTGAEVSVEQPLIHGLVLKGTMDGVTSEDVIAEFKSINSNGFSQIRKFGPKHDHVYQTHAYMWASGLQGARIVYENKDTQDMKEFWVERDPATIAAVETEFMTLAQSTHDRELLPIIDKCKETPDKWCQYRKICHEATSTLVFGSPEPRKRFVIQRASSTASA